MVQLIKIVVLFACPINGQMQLNLIREESILILVKGPVVQNLKKLLTNKMLKFLS